MSKKDTDLMVSVSECPKCASPLSTYWSCCYDPECCGIDDRIECESCDWEVEGYFQDLDAEEFKNLVPRKKDGLKEAYDRLYKEFSKKKAIALTIPEYELRIRNLKDKIACLQSEIKIYESKGAL